jgi:SOS response regulatory protein OraA/RecX
VAEKAVGDAFGEVDESAAVEAWIARKYRNVQLHEYLQDPKHLASAYRKLRYAGFSSSTSIRVLKRYANEADALEDLENQA